jgi:phosphoglycerate dehydrogenase-like enzyme
VRVMTAGHLAGARLGVTETEPPTTRCAASTG